MQTNPVMTLNKRREALKKLAKNPEAPLKEFHALLEDATEDERAVLAKNLPPAKVLGRGNRAVLSPVGGYLLAALGTNPRRTHKRFVDLYTDSSWAARRSDTDSFNNPHDAIMRGLYLGLSGRSDTWILDYIAATPAMEDNDAYGIWRILHTLVRERDLHCETPSYLWRALRTIFPEENRAEGHPEIPATYQEALEHIRQDPLLIERELWTCFRVGTALGAAADFKFLDYLDCHLDGFRGRFLTECLRSMLRDFTPRKTRVFHTLYRGMKPTIAENLARAPQLTAILQTQLSTSVGLAQEMLTPIVEQLSTEQIDALLDASVAVLLRTEKKLVKAQLNILQQLIKHHPEYTHRVHSMIAGIERTLPLELQELAQNVGSKDSTKPTRRGVKKIQEPQEIQSVEALQAQEPILIPDVNPRPRAPGELFMADAPISSDTELFDALVAMVTGTAPETELVRALAYLNQTESIRFNKAQIKYLESVNLNWGRHIHEFETAGEDIAFLILAIYIRCAGTRPIELPPITMGYRDFLWLDRNGQPIITNSMEYRPLGAKTKQDLVVNARGLTGLLQEQFLSLIPSSGYAEKIYTEPFETRNHAMRRTTWSTGLTQYAKQRIINSDSEIPYNRKLLLWEDPNDTSAPSDLVFEDAAFNTGSVREDYGHRIHTSKRYTYTSQKYAVGWYAWLMQNNLDYAAAQMMPALMTALYTRTVFGLNALLYALGSTPCPLGAPSYSALGIAASALAQDIRALTAESLAHLAERGMLDSAQFAEEVTWLLLHQDVLTNRVLGTLQDAASISPLAGWRIVQVLENMLPAVSDINRGGSFVQLLVQLAGEYGVSIKIPEVLRPKMKGSTVLAKSLRALEKLQPYPTELAEKARQEASHLNTINMLND